MASKKSTRKTRPMTYMESYDLPVPRNSKEAARLDAWIKAGEALGIIEGIETLPSGRKLYHAKTLLGR